MSSQFFTHQVVYSSNPCLYQLETRMPQGTMLKHCPVSQHCAVQLPLSLADGLLTSPARGSTVTSASSEDFAFALHVQARSVNLFPLFFLSHSCFHSSTSYLLLHQKSTLHYSHCSVLGLVELGHGWTSGSYRSFPSDSMVLSCTSLTCAFKKKAILFGTMSPGNHSSTVLFCVAMLQIT